MKRAFKWIGGIVAVGVLAAGGFGGWMAMTYYNADLNTVGAVDFDRELEIPSLAESVVQDGVRTFDLTMQRGESDLGQRSPTPTWGVNGSLLGPTLRARTGEQLRIRVNNDLGEASTLHWHGMHLPAEMDGGPHQMVNPGETWEPYWQVDQPAASLWYHPHPHGATAEHVYRGVAGMFIIDDAKEAALELPRDYGVDDIPLIVQDKKFHDDGTLDTSTSFVQSAGIVGDTVLVNGTPGPFFEVTTATLRLRVLNGSNTRPYNFSLSDEREFSVIGTDGGLLEAPVARRALQLSPGERAEIIVTFAAGEVVQLRSGPSDTSDRLAGGADHLDILEFRAADRLGGIAETPDKLVTVPRLRESSADQRRKFELSGFSVNGRTMDMDRVDEVVTVGDTEIWEITNIDGQTHNFHIHDVQFQILDIDGREPPAHLSGWKDTVWLPPNQRHRLIMTFADHSSERSPYMFHCHILRHEDQGLMGQFIVVEPGASTRPDDYQVGSRHDHPATQH